MLRHLRGCSHRETTVAVGIPERTVASRLAAAKRRLLVEPADPTWGPPVVTTLWQTPFPPAQHTSRRPRFVDTAPPR